MKKRRFMFVKRKDIEECFGGPHLVKMIPDQCFCFVTVCPSDANGSPSEKVKFMEMSWKNFKAYYQPV